MKKILKLEKMEKIQVLGSLMDSLARIKKAPVGDDSAYTIKMKYDGIDFLEKLIIKIDNHEPMERK